ncbi:S-acyl fatty acid synthase thioesterase, medium chain isoform X1 [Carcharodon carcharias]|uniref:S-acyl fatty acid synthase thioesterase, medium chain isoform X1 n=1 Tax=Carcharodon carcharias TaxID=13397 RepID=UPI001B7EE7E9|nr:S-acyl fatty acid synthase thioesterase, medium chain isoform X1 [Carcharodon carcharias]
MDKVVNCLYKRPEALYRLICFPWAGGGSIHYAQWGNHFNNSVEVYSIRLPGRETRSKEPITQNLQQLIEEISSTLLPSLKEKPFAFFGHSFGAYLSFATAEYIKRNHGLEPVHLFVSGASAPHEEDATQAMMKEESAARYPIQKRSELPDAEFLAWMTSIGGTPSEILANKDILQLFVPVLKADLRLVELIRYEKPQNKLFSCPISSFDGKEDVPHDLGAWNDLTSGEFTIHKLPGGHFYLKEPDNEKFLVTYITKHLETADVHYL